MWDNKPNAIKRNTVIKDYEDGGIKMVDLQKFINAIKCSWINRLLNPENKNNIKHIYMAELDKFGGKIIFQSNLAERDINIVFKHSKF